MVFTSHIYDGPIRSIPEMFFKRSNKTVAFKFLQITSIDSPANKLEFKMASQPYISQNSNGSFTFLVKREGDTGYSKELNDFNEDLKLVYDSSAYWLTYIQYRDSKYLVPTLGGVYSALKLAIVPCMICMKKLFWN